jgi:hypothetical protein
MNETNLTFYRVLALPTLLYGNRSWTIEERDIRGIKSVKIRYLRRVKGCTRLEKMKNKNLEKNFI